MFLLEASTTADKAFHVPPPSTHHTIRDATEDIHKMTRDLLARQVVQETDRSGSFVDPSTKGMEEKVGKGWIEDVLSRNPTLPEEDNI